MEIFQSLDNLEHLANVLGIPRKLYDRVKRNAELKGWDTVVVVRKMVLDFIMETAFRNRHILMTTEIHADGLFDWADVAIQHKATINSMEVLAGKLNIPMFLWLWGLVVASTSRNDEERGRRYKTQIRAMMRPPHIMFQFGAVLPDGLAFNPRDVAKVHPMDFPEEIMDIVNNKALAISKATLHSTVWLRTSRRGVWLNHKRVHDMPVIAAARIPGRHSMALLVQPSGVAHLVTITPNAQDIEVLLSMKLARPGPAARGTRSGEESKTAGRELEADAQTYVPGTSGEPTTNNRGIHSLSVFRRSPKDPRVIVTWSYRSVHAGDKVGIVDDMLMMVLNIPPGRRPLTQLPAVVACKTLPPIDELWDDYFLSGDPRMSYGVHENVLYGVTTASETRVDDYMRKVLPMTTVGYGENRCIFRTADKFASAVWGSPKAFFLATREGRLSMYAWLPQFKKYGEMLGVGPKNAIRGTCTAIVPMEARLLI